MSLTQPAGPPGSPTPEEPPSLSDRLAAFNPLKVIEDYQLQLKKQEWASWAEAEYHKCATARTAYERQWYLNIAFYMGRQYVAPMMVPGMGFRLTAPKAPPWRVRMVINKVRTAIRTECSKLTMNRPIPTVIPATLEDEDFSAARVCEQILQSEFHTMDFDNKFKSFVWWGSVTGNAYLKSWWDPNEIDPQAQPPALPNPMGPQFPPIPQVVPGKIKYDRVSPFHIYVPDLLAEDIEDQPYVIQVMTQPKLWVDKTFNMNSTEDSRATNTVLESAVLSPAATNQHFDSVLVKEVWIKPNAHKDFPEGGMLTIVNGKAVQCMQKWPLPFTEYPFYKFKGIPTGGFYTDSVIVDLIPLQKEYNRTKSQMIEIKNLMGKPKLLAPRGSINPKQVSSEPGQAVLYTPGFDKPDILPPVSPPAGMSEELDRLTQDFDDISGQHEITRGSTPAQVTSGTAIAFLQEQDDTKLTYQVASIEGCIEKLGTHYLKYATTYWTDERVLKIVGSDGAFEAFHWKSNQMKGNTDVRVQSGSGLPFSKAARTALLTEWMNLGHIAPQDAMEMIGISGFEKVIEDFIVDKRQAQRENLKMSKMDPQIAQILMQPPVGPDGQPMMGDDPTNPEGPQVPIDPNTQMPWTPQPPLPVNSWDNHEAHIHYHNQFRKTQQFELLPDEVKQCFELHVQGHQLALSLGTVGFGGMPIDEGSAQQQMEPGMEQEPTEEQPSEGGEPPM